MQFFTLLGFLKLILQIFYDLFTRLTFLYFFQNYFEELVSVRDKQLARLQLELTSVGEEREKERAELEVVIIELQQQL